jgi:archaellum component FlaF (FlaF/FlaG flagellin family)
MRKSSVCFALVVLIAALASCGVVSEQEKERAAITAALQKYLSERSGINLSAMNWEIKNLNRDRDTATVQVDFTAKQGGASMVMEYQMKKINNVWTVQKSGLHGGEGMPVTPGAGAAPAAPGALPPGHPPITPEPKAPAKTPPAPKKSS